MSSESGSDLEDLPWYSRVKHISGEVPPGPHEERLATYALQLVSNCHGISAADWYYVVEALSRLPPPPKVSLGPEKPSRAVPIRCNAPGFLSAMKVSSHGILGTITAQSGQRGWSLCVRNSVDTLALGPGLAPMPKPNAAQWPFLRRGISSMSDSEAEALDFFRSAKSVDALTANPGGLYVDIASNIPGPLASGVVLHHLLRHNRASVVLDPLGDMVCMVVEGASLRLTRCRISRAGDPDESVVLAPTCPLNPNPATLRDWVREHAISTRPQAYGDLVYTHGIGYALFWLPVEEIEGDTTLRPPLCLSSQLPQMTHAGAMISPFYQGVVADVPEVVTMDTRVPSFERLLAGTEWHGGMLAQAWKTSASASDIYRPPSPQDRSSFWDRETDHWRGSTTAWDEEESTP